MHEFWVFFIAGTSTAVGMLAIPQSVLHRVARVPGLNPNWLSLWGVPLTILGLHILLWIDTFTGFMMILVGLMLDRLDGKMATGLAPFVPDPAVTGWRRTWAELNHPGPTEMGKWLDALTDKFKILPVMGYCAWKGYLSPWGVALVVVFDLIGIVMRDPFNLVPEGWIRSSAATGAGKLKVLLQVNTILLVLPFHAGWITEKRWILDLFLWASVVFAVLSVLSKLEAPWPWVNRTVDAFTRPFRHQQS